MPARDMDDDMKIEREGQVQQQLTNEQLARLWNMQERYSGWTFTVAAVYIKAVQETFAAGVTSEEGVCRVLRCRKNTKQWRGIAEIRARLLGEWTEPLKSTP